MRRAGTAVATKFELARLLLCYCQGVRMLTQTKIILRVKQDAQVDGFIQSHFRHLIFFFLGHPMALPGKGILREIREAGFVRTKNGE